MYLKQYFGNRSRIDLALPDPDHFDADPDPAFHFEADLDPDPASQKESLLAFLLMSCLVFAKGKLIMVP
jgi:hypothetical protein